MSGDNLLEEIKSQRYYSAICLGLKSELRKLAKYFYAILRDIDHEGWVLSEEADNTVNALVALKCVLQDIEPDRIVMMDVEMLIQAASRASTPAGSESSIICISDSGSSTRNDSLETPSKPDSRMSVSRRLF